MDCPRILVTGFEPFGGDTINPSWEAVRRLPDRLHGAELVRLRLPVVFSQAGAMAAAAAREARARLVIATGVAAGRRALTPELLAVNYRLAGLPDNAGQRFHGCKIDASAPDAMMCALPLLPAIESVKAAGVPCQLSLSAGAYVCNDVYWRLLRSQADGGFKAVFVHVPNWEQLDAESAAKGLAVLISCLMQAANVNEV